MIAELRKQCQIALESHLLVLVFVAILKISIKDILNLEYYAKNISIYIKDMETGSGIHAVTKRTS